MSTPDAAISQGRITGTHAPSLCPTKKKRQIPSRRAGNASAESTAEEDAENSLPELNLYTDLENRRQKQ